MASTYSLGTLLAIVIPLSAVLLLSILLLLVFCYRLKKQKADIEKLNKQANAATQDERYNLRKKNPSSSEIPPTSKLRVPWYERFLFCGGCEADIADGSEGTTAIKEKQPLQNKAHSHGIDSTNSKSHNKGGSSSKKYEGRHEMELPPGQQKKDLKRSSSDVIANDRATNDIKSKNKSEKTSKSTLSSVKHPHGPAPRTSAPLNSLSVDHHENDNLIPSSKHHLAPKTKSKSKHKHVRSKSSPKDELEPAPLNINSDGVIVDRKEKDPGLQDKLHYEKYQVDPIDDVTSEGERKAREVLSRDRIGRNAVSRQHSINRSSVYSESSKQYDVDDMEKGQFYSSLEPSKRTQTAHEIASNERPSKFNIDLETSSRVSTQYKWLDPPISLPKVQYAENKKSMVGSVVEPLATMSPISESGPTSHNPTTPNVANEGYNVDNLPDGYRKSAKKECEYSLRDSGEYSATHSFSSSNILYLKTPNVGQDDTQEADDHQYPRVPGNFAGDDDSSDVDVYTSTAVSNNQSSPYARSTTPASRKSYPTGSVPIPAKLANSKGHTDNPSHGNLSGTISRSEMARSWGSSAPGGFGNAYPTERPGEGYRSLGSTSNKMELGSKQEGSRNMQKGHTVPDVASMSSKAEKSSLDGKVKKRSNNGSMSTGNITSYGTEWHLNRPSNSETASGTGTENTHGTYATAPSRAPPNSIREKEPKMPSNTNGLQSSIWGARRSMSTSSRASSLQFSVSDQADISLGYHRKKGSMGSHRAKQKLNKPLPMTPSGPKRDNHIEDDEEQDEVPNLSHKGQLSSSALEDTPLDQEEPQLEQFKEDGVVTNLGGMLFCAMFPYNPQLEDELLLTPKDEVRVYQVFDDGWCFARKESGGIRSHGFCPKVCLANSSRHGKEL